MLSPGTLPQYAAYRAFRPPRSSDGRSVRPSFNNTFPTRSGERVGSVCTVLNSKPGKCSMQSESGSQLTHPWRTRIFPPHKPLQDFVHWKMARSIITMQILPQTVGFDVGWFFRCWVDAKRVVLMTMWECRIALSNTAGGRLQSLEVDARQRRGHGPGILHEGFNCLVAQIADVARFVVIMASGCPRQQISRARTTFR